ncbi:3-oxoacyl-[acyl-carrier-protein] synthase II [Amycolatopsis xylanica]|uniref:3-oxoacyl-[acyl-carrier-protein] synthase II n=1 Tax=Amycolatopsis xylanica TaxID=589385 RepID=A0A1H3NR96_9PSEU|nr:beta-ketoacyl synthase N-terminal-like domain-containing protein [Amycolatopsis xylanica]SDY91200.1 3-oxoacyl-[acyl-carrier-protein] synthase II [Amycolatopsis xylanica]
MTHGIAITGIALATGFGLSAEDTWHRVALGETAVHAAGRFGGAYVAELTEQDTLWALAQRLPVDDLPPGTGITLGTNGAPETAWRTGFPYAALDPIVAKLGLDGPRAIFGTGCVASANALCHAVDLLRAGRVPAMLVGGIDLLNVTTMATFSSWKALDTEPSGPYSRSGGVNLGEGAAFLLLEADPGDKEVIAYVNGYGMTADAFHITAPPPSGEGLFRAMRLALRDAGVTPAEVDYVNGHGTGTPANDRAELTALRSLFGSGGPPLSSSKPQLGHTLGAAGVVEAAITAFAIRDSKLPPTINLDPERMPGWDVVPGTARPAKVDVAVTNSIAFGGANCVLVLGREPAADPGLGIREVSTVGSATVPDAEAAQGNFPRAYASRVDELGALSLAAAHLAWADAGFTAENRPDPDRSGLVLATADGPLSTIEELHAARERDELHLISPVTAPNIVASVTAGYVSLTLGLKGPLSAVTSGQASEEVALDHATNLLTTGRADVMLVVTADERGPGARARVLKGEPL